MRLLLIALFNLIRNIFTILLIVTICVPLFFVAVKGNQPMQVAQVPKGMTYWEFISDRVEAAKVIEPSRCGWGMFLSFAMIGPVYSVVYTDVGIHPDGFLAKVTAPDPDIPKGVENAVWQDVPHIWWNVFERLSWTMLAKPKPGCQFRPIALKQ